MRLAFFDALFTGQSLLLVRTFNEVAATIRARHPELEPTIQGLEDEFRAAHEKLCDTTNRQEAHAAIDRLFDLRLALGKHSNNPVNQNVEAKG